MNPDHIRKPDKAKPSAASWKIATDIVGLDEILEGGVPASSLTLLSGGPGTGKTMLGMEFLIRGAEAGHAGIILSFEERAEDLRRYAANLGWKLEELEAAGLLKIIATGVQPEALYAGDFDLRGILAILEQETKAMSAERVLIDAPDVFLRLLDSPAKERVELMMVHDWLRNHGLTTMMTVKASTRGEIGSQYDFLDFMADCVIYLDQRVYEQVTTRRLRVVKYRGSSYSRNEYPFSITLNGVWIIPVTRADLQHRALGESMSSGIQGLDEILGGGYRRNSCTLISGGAGTGKTTFAASFVRSVTEQGERVLYLDFEESWDALISCMLSPGIDLTPAEQNGKLRFISTMPESQGIEEHLIQIYRIIAEFEPKHLVLDALSACRRMGSHHAAFDFLLRLIDHCKREGITTLLTNLTNSPYGSDEFTGIDLSSVIDTVVILSNQIEGGSFKRQIAIVKSRGRAHSSNVHSFTITDRGVVIQNGEVA